MARWVSGLANPVLVAVPLVLAVAWRDTASWTETLRWGGLYLLLADLVPMALLMFLARRSQLANLQHARGQERLKPLLISLICLGTTTVLYHVADTPPLLRRLAWVQLVQAAPMTVITPVWQISFHGAAIGALVTTVLLLYGAGTWPLLGLPLLVGWSQVERRRHTALQVLAGILLAVLLYGLGFGL